MYQSHFGLHEKPFSLAPDPAYFYRTDSHGNALDLIRHGIDAQRGLIVLSGTSGLGKTTICRTLLEQLERNTFTALALNPYVSEEDLLQVVLQDFGVISRREGRGSRPPSAGPVELLRTLHDFLKALPALGARALLVVDEAQRLPAAVLAQLRRLACLDASGKPLLQILLVGQLNLREVLRQSSDLDTRVSIRYRLRPLLAEETAAYVTHRLAIAGARSSGLFSPRALQSVHRATGGNPRLVNILCDRALTVAYSSGAQGVDVELVRGAASRLGLEPDGGSVLGWLRRVAAL